MSAFLDLIQASSYATVYGFGSALCLFFLATWVVRTHPHPHATLTLSLQLTPHKFIWEAKNKAQRRRDLEDKLVNGVTRPLTRAASVVIDRKLYPGKNARSQMPGKDSVGCPFWGIIYGNNYFLLGTSSFYMWHFFRVLMRCDSQSQEEMIRQQSSVTAV